jgi:hypothetical protein
MPDSLDNNHTTKDDDDNNIDDNNNSPGSLNGISGVYTDGSTMINYNSVRFANQFLHFSDPLYW